MTKKKLNILITIVALILYLGGVFYQFTSAEYLVGNQFSTETNNELDSMESLLFNDENNQEIKNVNNLANKLAECSITWSPYCERTYPLAFGIYDKNGVMVERSGYNIRYNNYYINVDKYINDAFIKKFVEAFPTKALGGVVISEFNYFEEDGKIIPTKVVFIDVNNKNKKLDLQFEASNENEKKEYTRFFNEVKEDGEYNGQTIDFNFDGFYRDSLNKKIQQKLDKEIDSCVGKVVSNDDGVSFLNTFSSDWSNGGGFSGSDSFDYTYFVEIANSGYAIRIMSSYSKFYNVLVSAPFVEGVTYLSVLFLVVMTTVYTVANKLYNKNKSLNDARKVFTSAAAHELKTPITIINSQCECLIENIVPEKQQEYLSNIYSQNRHMSILVNNLLQYNRIDSANLDKKKFDLRDVCLEELDKYTYLIENKNLVVNTNKLLNITIFADEKLIKLVIDNFISNAIKNTPNGKTIEIACSKSRFSIYNQGSYIFDEDKNRIWEIFSRSVSNDVIESSGMGLAICKKILQTHNYKYGFVNRNDGVEFYFEY